jgi:site-specific DNA recombinase
MAMRRKGKQNAPNNITYRETKDVVLYIRVSSDEQARNAYGPESQEAEIRLLCAKNGWNVVQVFKDLGYSGWRNVPRPGFQAMKEYVKKNKNVIIVFYDYSRIYRRALHALEFFENMDALGVYTVSATNPNLDCRTADGRATRRSELIEAEKFSDVHSERQQSRMKNTILSGRWPGAAPLGFVNIRAKKGASNIAPVESIISLILKAFLLFRSGAYTPAELHREMTRQGLRNSKGNPLKIDHFTKMLRNPAYNGWVPSKKYGNYPGLHKKIVNDEVFRNVQLILDGKKPSTASYVKNRADLPLRRFLHCPVCSRGLTGGPSKGHLGKYYNYYRCTSCNGVSVRAEVADEQFLELLRQLPSGEALSSEFQSVLKEEWEKTVGDEPEIEARLNSELGKSQQNMKNLLMKYVNDDPAVKPYFEGLRQDIEDKIADIQVQLYHTQETKATFEELMEFSRSMSVNLANAWQVADINQKQRVQNTLFPGGLKLSKEKQILNPDNDCVFCQLQNFLRGNFYMVDAVGIEPTTCRLRAVHLILTPAATSCYKLLSFVGITYSFSVPFAISTAQIMTDFDAV